MKAIICDADILSHLQPQQVEAYLQATGWRDRNRIPDKVSIWTRDTYPEDRLKIQLPVDQNFDDYPQRMYEIMSILEKAENRSQIDILSELVTTAPNITIQGVVIQIQAPNPDNLNGEIIIFGVLFDKLRKIHSKLADYEYILAIKAYQERLPILCSGDLVKENNNFILKNIRNISLEKL